jgi:glutaredoxin
VRPPVVTVYLRDGCHLCEQALEVLRPLADRAGARVETVDIESDERLHARYLERIPVIALDGEELYDFFVDPADLAMRLAAQAGR